MHVACEKGDGAAAALGLAGRRIGEGERRATGYHEDSRKEGGRCGRNDHDH